MYKLRYIILWFLLMCGYSKAHAQYGFDTVSVYFEIGSAQINENQSFILDSLVQVAQLDERKMLIFGYADYLGNQDPNLTLSDRRAESVYQYMLNVGLPSHYVIQYSGVGQVNQKNSTEHGNQDFRKVDIFLKRNKRLTPRDTIDQYVDYTSNDLISDVVNFGDFKDLKVISSLDVGQTFILKDIHFYLSRSTVVLQSVPYLDALVNILKAYPNLQISLEGHVCCINDDGDSYDFDTKDHKLSVNRAEVIYKYLIRNGIDVSRLSFKGFGRKNPIYPIEETEQQSQANRRVEVRIVSK